EHVVTYTLTPIHFNGGFCLFFSKSWCLLSHFCVLFQNSNQSDVADGGSIFTERLKSWTETNEKKIILSQIISMYLKMFENIGPATSKLHVKNIHNALRTLNDNLAESFKKVNDLMELARLPMNDLKIQRKAVNELFPTLQKLLLDHSTAHIKRKRSQSQKRKCRC
uniref:Interferon gamma n=1 Tax=Chelydra serpentina TaxID=8475 RepID=A0A8C3XIB7_CHESE